MHCDQFIVFFCAPCALIYLLTCRHDLVLGRFFKLGDVLCRVLAFSSACVNPLLYGWMNDHYRAAFLALVTRRGRRRRALGAAAAASGGGRSGGVRPGSIRLSAAAGEGKRSRLAAGPRDDGNFVEIQLTPMTRSTSFQPQ